MQSAPLKMSLSYVLKPIYKAFDYPYPHTLPINTNIKHDYYIKLTTSIFRRFHCSIQLDSPRLQQNLIEGTKTASKSSVIAGIWVNGQVLGST